VIGDWWAVAGKMMNYPRRLSKPTTRGAALDHARETPVIFVLGACLTANLVKQAAPGNVSTRVTFVSNLRR
jgi:hypothetical protein